MPAAIRLNIRRGVIPIFKKVLWQEAQSTFNEILNTIAIPLTFFLAFGLGLRGYIQNIDGVPYMVFIAPGLITLTVMLEAYRTGAWGLWMDRWHQKVLDEYRIKPVETTDIIIGEIMGGFVVATIKGTIVAAILLMMAPFSFSLQHLLLYWLTLFPGCILFTCLGCMVGTTLPKPDLIAQTQTILITPLLYLGGLFFPIHSLPAKILPIIKLLPTTALFDGGRQMILTGSMPAQYLPVLLVSAVLSFVLATWWFNKVLSQ